jgi:hypothetical protein
MSKKIVTTLVLSVALVLVAVGGVFAYSRAAAQGITPGVPAQGTQTAPGAQGQPNEMRDSTRDTNLASALGISLETLQAAFQSANEAGLKQAVSNGTLTQEQADQLIAKGLPNHPMRELGRPGSSDGVDFEALLAQALGISSAQLQTARQEAQAAELNAAVANGQLTQEQVDIMKARDALMADTKFQASMKAAYEAGLEQAVSDGVLTQAQADLLVKENVAGPGGFDGRGQGGRGPGGPGGPDGPDGAGKNK